MELRKPIEKNRVDVKTATDANARGKQAQICLGGTDRLHIYISATTQNIAANALEDAANRMFPVGGRLLTGNANRRCPHYWEGNSQKTTRILYQSVESSKMKRQ